MKYTRVQYKVREDYADTNKQNVAAVMAEVRALNNDKIQYSTYVLEDGVSFMHLAFFADEASSQIIPNLDSFKNFRTQLKDGLEVPPKAESMSLIGSSFDIF